MIKRLRVLPQAKTKRDHAFTVMFIIIRTFYILEYVSVIVMQI